jgi:hypothetical protein
MFYRLGVTKHLKEYKQYNKTSLDFEDNLNFFYAYPSFLDKKGLGVNTNAKDSPPSIL